MKKLLLVSFIVGMMGCNGGSSSEDQSQLETFLAGWLDMGVSDYSFHYEETGFVPNAGDVWAVEVRDDEVFDVLFVGDGEPSGSLSAETAFTILDLFGRMSSCKMSETCTVTQEIYDADFFFPSQYRSSVGSEGGGFNVTNFTVL